MIRWMGALALVFVAYGCIEDGTPAEPFEGDGGVVFDGRVADLGGDVDVFDLAVVDRGLDAAPDMTLQDEGTDVARPDMRPDGAVAAIESCQEACNRYAACERFDVWGDEGACLDACARSDESNDLSRWYGCLEVEACGLLQLCHLPDPAPLDCAGLCALVESCEVALPFADCEADCEASQSTEAITACGESLITCDEVGFNACLTEGVFPECGRRCAASQACNLEGPGCLNDCVAGGLDADPLRRAAQRERNRCVGLSGADCHRVEACLSPDSVGPVDRATFCQAWDRCFGEQLPCNILIDDFIRPDDPNLDAILACGMANLVQCPEDPFEIFERCMENPGPVGPTCLDLCNAQNLCDVLPAGFNDAFACNQACLNAQRQDPDEAARIALQLPCASAERCPDLVACLEEASPNNACDSYCGALNGCDVAPDGCAQICDDTFFRARAVAARACVAEAGDDCASVIECMPEPAVGCEAECARRVPCRRINQARCMTQCDDADFNNPEAHLQSLACVLTAPICDQQQRNGQAVNQCDASFGQGCLGWCQLQTECAGEGDLVACLEACGAGLAGVDGANRRFADACLADANGCDALAACVPAEAPPCAAWCDAQAGCGVPREDCVAVCGVDALSGYQARTQMDCIQAAEDDCDAVRVCVAPYGSQDLDVSEANFCALMNQCNLEENFPCNEIYRMALNDGGPSAVACMVARAEQACPRDPIDLYMQCVEGEGGSVSSLPCEVLCELRAICDDLGADDLLDCRATCSNVFSGRVDGDEARRLEAELPCMDAWSCDDLVACRAALDPDTQCQNHCAALQGCGLDNAGCARRCDQRFEYLREGAWRACVREAGDDCEAVAACAPEPAPDCQAYCREARDCGIRFGRDFDGEQDCERLCDDAHFNEPAPQSLRVACAQRAADCPQMRLCVQGDPMAGLDAGCVGYCRAVTECAPDAERRFGDCVVDCAEGFGGDEGLIYAAARGCAIRLGPDAACEDLLFCPPPEAPEVDCAAYCEALESCDIEGEACVADCEAGADRLEVACAVETHRVHGGCMRMAACVDFVAPPVSDACDRLCDRRVACDGSVDPFQCRLGCSPAPEGLEFRAACAEYTRCGAQAQCDQVNAAEPVCVEPCGALALCGGFENNPSCVVECTGNYASPDSDAQADQAFIECLDAAGDLNRCAEAVRACFDVVGTACERVCGELDRCEEGMGDFCMDRCRAAGEGAQFADAVACADRVLDGGVGCDEDLFEVIMCFDRFNR